MGINKNIFKAYDIRGKYPDEINEESAYKIGRAFIVFLKEKNKFRDSKLNLVVGRDMRLSSPALFKALIEGIAIEGANIINIGLATTPMLYFAVAHYNFDGGINVTGSHIPKDYNGFKFVREKAIPVSEDTGLREIEELAMQDRFEQNKPGEILTKNILNDYVNHSLIFSDTDLIKGLKIVIDTGNGMGGLVIDNLFEKLKCNITPLYFELDGSFPNHAPDPLVPENLIDLQKKVLEINADLGIALDGDADRVVFVDEKGKVVTADLITALIAKLLLRQNSGEKIIYDLRSSWVVKEEIEKAGGVPVIYRVGHSFIKEKMRKENILFAGELSGHYYLRENYFIESPLIVILKILEDISAENKPFSKIIQPLKRYFASGEINFQVEDKKKKIGEIEEAYRDAKNTYHLDGLSIEYDDWWFNLRPSNTENLLRLNLEAKTKELMEKKKKGIIRIIEN